MISPLESMQLEAQPEGANKLGCALSCGNAVDTAKGVDGRINAATPAIPLGGTARV
jgi:hypothetical protein